MLSINIVLDAEGVWEDLQTRPFEWYRNVPGEPEAKLSVAGLNNGLASGKPSVAIRIDRPEGEDDPVVVETSLALFLSAADALKARFGDPRG